MYGKVERENKGSLVPGQELVIAGTIGLRGAARIARAENTAMRERFSDRLVRRMQSLDENLPEGDLEYFKQYGALECEEVSEGGVMAALWNLTGAYKAGMEIELRRIPILQETVEVCEAVDVNPYRLQSGGCYVLAADCGWSLCRSLREQGIPAVVIGRVTGDGKRMIYNGEIRTYMDRPQDDEIKRIIN